MKSKPFILCSYLVLILLLLAPAQAFAAGSAKASTRVQGKIRYITWTWTSDALGAVSGTTLDQFAVITKGGTAFALLHDPEAGVTDLYDVTIAAEWSVPTETATRTIDFADVTGGQGTDLSNSVNGGSVSLTKPFSFPSARLTLTIAGAGNATSGTFVLCIWEE